MINQIEIWTCIVLACAFLLDSLLGETRKLHPLVGFGNCATLLEKYLNKENGFMQLFTGSIAWLILVLPVPLGLMYLYDVIPQSSNLFFTVDVVIVYFAIGHRSLREHGLQIFNALCCDDIKSARQYCRFIVSRDTCNLSQQEICRATTESMLENGNDAIIATLVWYAIGGAPMVIIHRLANTLDAMWGYRNQKYHYFGKFSARMDDALGYLPAKLNSLLFAIQGVRSKKFIFILTTAYQQAKHYKSLNGGWVMSSGATLINTELGGKATYHNAPTISPTLGVGEITQNKHIKHSLLVVKNAALLFISIVFIIESTLFLVN